MHQVPSHSWTEIMTKPFLRHTMMLKLLHPCCNLHLLFPPSSSPKRQSGCAAPCMQLAMTANLELSLLAQTADG